VIFENMTLQELREAREKLQQEIEEREFYAGLEVGDLVGFLVNRKMGRGVIVEISNERRYITVEPLSNRKGWRDSWGDSVVVLQHQVLGKL
jgi:hypothetical protein